MSVKKTTNGTWMYDVRHPVTKKRKRVRGFVTRAEADHARSILFDRWRSEKHGTTLEPTKRAGELILAVELETVAQAFESSAKDRGFFGNTDRRTAETIRKIRRNYIADDLRVVDFCDEHINLIIRGELSRGVKPSSIKTYLVRLKTALTAIKKRHPDLLAGWEIPAIAVPGAKVQYRTKLRRVWGEDELQRLLTVLSEPEKYISRSSKRYRDSIRNWEDTCDFIGIAALTGMRKTEILLLEWSKIYFEWGVMQVRTLKKKSVEEIYRDIPIGEDLKALLLRRRERIARAEGLVFPRWRVDRPDDSEWIYRTLKRRARLPD
jgi:integrase/ribosomal protein L34